MRSLLLTSTVVVVVVALALLLFFDGSSRDDSLSRVDVSVSRAVRSEAASDAAPASAPATVTDEPAREAAPEPEAPRAEDPQVPQALIRGTVVDSNGEVVVGVELELSSVDGPWRDGVDVPPLDPDSRWRREGYRTTTGEAGAFRFEVPVPTSDWISLTVNCGRMHGRAGRNFGPAGGRDEPRLVQGENVLGELVTPLAGVLSGSVTDTAGVPIAGAEVRYEGVSGGYGIVTETGADGRYVLGHLPAGHATLSARSRGTLIDTRESAEDVCVLETLVGPDFVLQRAPTITGNVVDDAGAPVDGIVVEGWPIGSGSAAGARTDADGRFVMNLPQDEPYSLVIERDPRFRKWGGHSVTEATFEPGATDVRIVLECVELMTLVVVDAETGEAVEDFGLFAGEIGGYRIDHMLHFGTFPGGRVELHAAPGPNQKVWVRSPLHVPFEDAIAFDEGEARQQTIRLQPGASVFGRALLRGELASGVIVSVAPERLPKEDGAEVDPDDWWGDTWRFDVPDAAGHARRARTRRDGSPCATSRPGRTGCSWTRTGPRRSRPTC